MIEERVTIETRDFLVVSEAVLWFQFRTIGRGVVHEAGARGLGVVVDPVAVPVLQTQLQTKLLSATRRDQFAVWDVHVVGHLVEC